MEVVNTATTPEYRWGILVYFTPKTTDIVHHSIHITNNNVHDVYASYYFNGPPNKFYTGGIYVWAAAAVTTSFSSATPPNSRLADVIIQGNTVKDITGHGIVYRGESIWDGGNDVMNWNNLSTGLVVKGNFVQNVLDGIMWIGTSNALVEYNTVDAAGGTGKSGTNQATSTVVVAAVWPACTEGGIVQHNEVRNTKVLPGDGQAFDSDMILKGTLIFQYNYTHNNEGGFLLSCMDAAHPDEPGSQTIARYNISQNDGYPTAGIWPDPNNKGKFIHYNKSNTIIYNNIFFLGSGGIFSILNNSGTTLSNTFKNNIFYGPSFVLNCGNDNNIIDNNCFWGGCEKSLSSGITNSINIEPQFVNVGTGSNGLSSVAGYKLKPTSQCINKGSKMDSNGGRDFWGVAINGLPDVGAYERPDITPILNLLLND